MLYSNFKQKVWYTPPSQNTIDKPVSFQITTLPYRFVDLLLHSVDEDDTDIMIDINKYILDTCVLDYRNIVSDFDKVHTLAHLRDLLPESLIAELVSKVLNLWSPTAEFMSTLVTTIELMVDPRFSDKTWHCKTCQAKGLDKQRNCPFLNKINYDVMFKLPFMDEMITTCPVADKDEALGKTVLEAYNFKESNNLPEAGGIGDQPILYVIGSQHLAERLKHFQRVAEEAARPKK